MMEDDLKQRIAELEKERSQQLARLNAIEGAILENKRWLSKTEAPDEGASS